MTRIRLDIALYGGKADSFLAIFNKVQLKTGNTISKPAMIMILIQAFKELDEVQQSKVINHICSSLKSTSKINETFDWTKDAGTLKK